MRIGIFGTGYVGLVTGLCFAEVGNEVICADVDSAKIARLQQGESPIYEAGLESLLKKHGSTGKIHFSNDVLAPVHFADILFIAVGTPTDPSGDVQLEALENLIRAIAENATQAKTVVIKSTVPVGTTQRLWTLMTSLLKAKGASFLIPVVNNPEFLREGSAVYDFQNPSRIIIGTHSETEAAPLLKIYGPLAQRAPILIMDPQSAELAKHAANAFLATKISFMNELSALCEKTGANIDDVQKVLGSDARIGPDFLHAGLGYGGSCLPKDVKALIKISQQMETPLEIVAATEKANQKQLERICLRSLDLLNQRGTATLWGLSFKPGTDDVREAPALHLARMLLKKGIRLKASDPAAIENAQKHLGEGSIEFFMDPYEALADSELLIVTTEWPQYLSPDFAKMKNYMQRSQLLDARNIYNPEEVRAHGFQYHSIGRPV